MYFLSSLQVVQVMYALSILLLVTAVYAILASQLYGDRSPENFGRFSYALFSVRAAAQIGMTMMMMMMMIYKNSSYKIVIINNNKILRWPPPPQIFQTAPLPRVRGA